MNPISCVLKQNLTCTETLTDAAGSLPPGNGNITHSGMDQTLGPLSASTTVPGAGCAYFQIDLVAGSAQIDLTALVGTNGSIVNGTGLKVRAFMIEAPAGNGAVITITPAVSNGYNLLGASFTLPIDPGDQYGPFYKPTSAPVIGPTAKLLQLTGSGTDALNVGMIIG